MRRPVPLLERGAFSVSKEGHGVYSLWELRGCAEYCVAKVARPSDDAAAWAKIVEQLNHVAPAEAP